MADPQHAPSPIQPRRREAFSTVHLCRQVGWLEIRDDGLRAVPDVFAFVENATAEEIEASPYLRVLHDQGHAWECWFREELEELEDLGARFADEVAALEDELAYRVEDLKEKLADPMYERFPKARASVETQISRVRTCVKNELTKAKAALRG